MSSSSPENSSKTPVAKKNNSKDLESIQTEVAEAEIKKTTKRRYNKKTAKNLIAPEVTKEIITAKKANVKKVKVKGIKLSRANKLKFETMLHQLQDQFSNRHRIHRENALLTGKDSSHGNAGIATHIADLGTDTFQQFMDTNQMRDDGDVLEMIEDALLRLENGEFGICLDCGKEIPMGRLEAKPYARYCIDCKEKREQQETPSYRHR